jgi:alkylation response protein AidB-like acyl-CoA dehydrogenase
MTLATSEFSTLEVVQRLRPIIEHYREQGERERRLPEAVLSAMADEGLFKLWLPREYGGRELDFPSYLATVEALAAIDSAAGWALANTGTASVQAAYLPEATAREIFAGGELGAGSVTPRGRAIPVEGGYRVSGRWPFASGCHSAQWLGGNCLVFDGETPRMSPMGMPAFTLMFFPRSQCQIIDEWYTTGMRATGSADFAVEDVFVPEERTFLVFGGQPRIESPLYRMHLEVQFFTCEACVALGIARGAIDAFVELAMSKTPTLSQSPLAERPTIHAGVARAEAAYQSARAYLQEVAREIWAEVEAGEEITDATEARRRLACLNVSEASEAVVDAMYRLGGTSSIQANSRLDRALRDVHTVNQHIAVSPVWWEKTGQSYFGLGLGMP